MKNWGINVRKSKVIRRYLKGFSSRFLHPKEKEMMSQGKKKREKIEGTSDHLSILIQPSSKDTFTINTLGFDVRHKMKKRRSFLSRRRGREDCPFLFRRNFILFLMTILMIVNVKQRSIKKGKRK